MRKAIPWFILTVIFSSCGNDDADVQQINNQDSSWQSFAAFQGESLLNSYVDNQVMVIAGHERVVSQFAQDSGFSAVLDIFSKSFNSRPTGNKELVLYKNQEVTNKNWELIFIPTTQKYECDASSSSIFSSGISIASIDSSLLSKNAHLASNSFLDPIGILDDQNVFHSIISDNESYFFLKLKITTNSFFNGVNQLDCFEYEIEPMIIEPLPDEISGDYKYATIIDSKFYSYFDDNTLVIIDEGGNIIDGQLKEGQPIIFEERSKIYAFIPSTGELYEQEGLGNWNLKKDNSPVFTSESAGIKEIDNSLIFYSKNQIFNLDIDSLEFLEIVNEGITNSNHITSISEFNNKIWLTTLEGLYFKEKDNFYQFK